MEISFDKYNEKLNNNSIEELFNTPILDKVVFKYPSELDERSGYFLFMSNYMQNKLREIIGVSIKNLIENATFDYKEDAIYYENKKIFKVKEYSDGMYTVKEYIKLIWYINLKG